MFVVFLPALNFRGNRSPYLWWFHKLHSALGDQAGYICGDEYFRPPEELLAEGRLEASSTLAERYHYRLPEPATLSNLLRADIPVTVWQSIEALYPANPLAAFRHYSLQEAPLLFKAINQALDQLNNTTSPLEAVITCVNCATLTKVCKERGVSLIHIELGPLREPQFLQTAYFDFSGVNGNTEAHSRYLASNYIANDDSEEDLQLLLCDLLLLQKPPKSEEASFELGVCLQIEDDSNIVCYSNGHSSLSLINDARRAIAEKKVSPPVLIRSHPGSHFAIRSLPSGLAIDSAPSSLAFAKRCKRIQTINSGLAVEALLLGRNAVVLGESPFSFCSERLTGQCINPALQFFLMNYAVPWGIAFTPDYIRWRLGHPTEPDIRNRHMKALMNEKIRHLEQKIVNLEQQLEEIRSSLSWRITLPLRKLIRFFSKNRQIP